MELITYQILLTTFEPKLAYSATEMKSGVLYSNINDSGCQEFLYLW